MEPTLCGFLRKKEDWKELEPLLSNSHLRYNMGDGESLGVLNGTKYVLDPQMGYARPLNGGGDGA